MLHMRNKGEEGAKIHDPTCGSGSLLIKAAQQIGSKNVALYGQENNGSTWALAVMNMFLHDFDNANIRWGDTIRNPLHLANSTTLKEFLIRGFVLDDERLKQGKNFGKDYSGLRSFDTFESLRVLRVQNRGLKTLR